MTETTYGIEKAKSGRSSCRKCKQKIDKGEIRIKVEAEGREGYTMTQNYHVECFAIPKKYTTKANHMTTDEFVNQILVDESGEILPAMADEIAAKLGSNVAKKKAAGGSGDNDGDPMAAIKAAYEKAQAEGESAEPAAKKAKSDMSEKVEAYAMYKTMKNDVLKDMLGWNHQFKTGTKDFLVFKCIDGHVNGRLAPCPLCTGGLKIDPSMNKVICNGNFDESMQMRVPCTNEYELDAAPRLKPWYHEEPTEEQAKEMERVIEEARGGGTATGDHGDDIEALKKKAAELEWKLTGKAGIKKALGDLLNILMEHPKKLDLPEDEQDARAKLGPIIQRHRDKTAEEVVPIVVEELGFKEEKAAKAAKKEAATEDACANPANAPIVAVIKELAELYFKEGNRNAGASYSKATTGLMGVTFEITKDNAKKLDKGANKVAGVGKGTAEKIHEFLTTGKIEKLEEKRAAVGL